MPRKPKFKPVVTRVELDPEQAVLTCLCYYQGWHDMAPTFVFAAYAGHDMFCGSFASKVFTGGWLIAKTITAPANPGLANLNMFAPSS